VIFVNCFPEHLRLDGFVHVSNSVGFLNAERFPQLVVCFFMGDFVFLVWVFLDAFVCRFEFGVGVCFDKEKEKVDFCAFRNSDFACS
jgi:hypothetical protein